MSIQKIIQRHSLIIGKLQRKSADFKEITSYLDLESEIQGYDFRVSKRTFQRDLKDIEILYGIEIEYDKHRLVYHIVTEDNNDLKQRILESYTTFNALKLNERLSKYIHFEEQKASGTVFFSDLLRAIEKRKKVIFSYKKFEKENTYQVKLEPLALKEFRSRWYLLVIDPNDNILKSFGLDRMKDLKITKESFKYPKGFDVHQHFKYCFGITGPNNKEPQEILLSFTAFQGKYIKTLPLHHTQEIVKDDEKELQVKLKLIPTFEFIMELLSYGETMKVLKSESLQKKIYQKLNKTIENYTP